MQRGQSRLFPTVNIKCNGNMEYMQVLVRRRLSAAAQQQHEGRSVQAAGKVCGGYGGNGGT